MKQLLRKMSLKRRLWVSFVLLTVVCITATGTYVSVFFSREMEMQATKTSQDTLNKTVQVLDERLRNIIVLVSTFMMSEPFQQTMNDVQTGNGDQYYKRLSQLQTPFAQLMLAEQSIDSVLLHSPIGDFYSTEHRKNQEIEFGDTILHEKIEATSQNRWNKLWVSGHSDELFSREEQVISFIIKPLFDRQVANTYVIVNIREDYLQGLIGSHIQNSSLNMLIMDRSGFPVFSSDEEVLKREHSVYEGIGAEWQGNYEYISDYGEHYLINYATLEMNPDWVMIGSQSKSVLLQPVRQMSWTILSIMGVFVFLALIMSSMLSSLLLKPLFKLRNLMLKVERNNLNVRFESIFEDEISQVGYKFNRMMEQISELIEEVKASEKEKRKSEIKALQAQIDPHFLYNTLNTIYWKSEMSERQAVSEMIVSLSLLFRLGLNNGQEITTLRQEMEHVRQYLTLQVMCYPDLFDYIVEEVSEELLDIPVLKLLLQPLVENCILHGFQEISYKGKIVIQVCKQMDYLLLSVSDNGIGMDALRVERMLNGPESEHTSYALTNVRARLSLYYGQTAMIKLGSEPGVKTTVSLIIPIAKMEVASL